MQKYIWTQNKKAKANNEMQRTIKKMDFYFFIFLYFFIICKMQGETYC